MRLLLFRGESFDPNFYYHSGVDIDHAFFLSGRTSKLFVPKMNERIARKGFKGEVIVFKDPYKELAKHIRRKPVLYDPLSMSAEMAARLRRICGLKGHSKELLRMRAVKGKDEISHISKAARLTKELLHSLDLKRARTELDAERQIRVAAAELGAELAFDPIVATDSSSGFPHYRAAKKRLGSIVLIDCGLRHGHYCADITRCFILDGDRKKKDEYERLQGILHSIIDELPGLERGSQVARLSQGLMRKAGFPEMPHSIGHGIGLDVHELPRLSSRSKDRLKGSAMAIEPAFYKKGYGMRFEETIFFDGKKVRIL